MFPYPVSRIPYPDLAVCQFDGGINLRLEDLRRRFAFADELPHLVSVS